MRNGNPRIEQNSEGVIREDDAERQVMGCCRHEGKRNPHIMTTE
jgi:hypothetical protein